MDSLDIELEQIANRMLSKNEYKVLSEKVKLHKIPIKKLKTLKWSKKLIHNSFIYSGQEIVFEVTDDNQFYIWKWHDNDLHFLYKSQHIKYLFLNKWLKRNELYESYEEINKLLEKENI